MLTDDLILWRYLTDEKFDRLLNAQSIFDDWADPSAAETRRVAHFPEQSQGSLWCAFPRTFRDALEGTFPALNASNDLFFALVERYADLDSQQAATKRARFLSLGPTKIRRAIQAMAHLCGVSCWHENTQESERMWREYVPDGRGVVVRTTVSHLIKQSLIVRGTPNELARPSVHMVQYVDHGKCFLDHDGYRFILGIKDKACFKHEREIRLIADSPMLARSPMTILHRPTADDYIQCADHFEKLVEQTKTSCNKGFNLAVDLAKLVQEVRVAPGADSAYVRQVKDRLKSKVKKTLVTRSHLHGG